MRILKDTFPVDLHHQSHEIPNSGGVRQSCLSPPRVAIDHVFDEVRTVADAILRGQKVSGDGPCLGWHSSSKPEYEWLSYGEVIRRYRHISSGLVQIGMKPGQDTFVGIYAKNCVEWVLVEHACYTQSTIPVPLYDTLGPSACSFILNQVSAEMVVCDTVERAKFLLEADVSKLRHIILISQIEIHHGVKEMAEKKGITIHRLKDVEDLGRNKPGTFILPNPKDLATVCYTSGTTGDPKGVMLTHSNLIAEAAGFITNVGVDFMSAKDCYLSFLPLAHMAERSSQASILMVGTRIGFSRGEIALLADDFKTLRPTMMMTVPRVLNKIFDKVQIQANSSKVKRILLDVALRAKQSQLEKGVIRNDSMWDCLVLKNIRNALGGRLRLIVSVGAPIRDEVLTFFRCAMGCAVIQAYGQTEATAAITCTVIGDCTTGVVGPPLACCHVKLVSVPDMDYWAERGEGEICVRGPIVTKGYFDDPRRTQEAFDQEGWLHTGDIGRWTENGSLAVVDRVKHILKLSQGEYVSPEKVENIYLASPLVDQVFVDGDPLESCVVAIVVPDTAALEAHCKEEGIHGELTQLCQNQEVKKMVCGHLYKLGQEAGLKGFEQVKAVHLQTEPFSMKNGLLTATLKMKRAVCRRQFKDTITALYESLPH